MDPEGRTPMTDYDAWLETYMRQQNQDLPGLLRDIAGKELAPWPGLAAAVRVAAERLETHEPG
jgi:hypothetical protein